MDPLKKTPRLVSPVQVNKSIRIFIEISNLKYIDIFVLDPDPEDVNVDSTLR